MLSLTSFFNKYFSATWNHLLSLSGLRLSPSLLNLAVRETLIMGFLNIPASCRNNVFSYNGEDKVFLVPLFFVWVVSLCEGKYQVALVL